MSAPVDVLAAVPAAPSSVATWQVAEKVGISQARALRELRRLEANGEITLKAAEPVNRSALVRHWWQRAVLAALLLALGGCAAPPPPEPVSSSVLAVDGEVAIPADLIVTSPRICAALAVYALAEHDDWGLRAAIALTALNGFRAAARVPNCAAGVGAALTQEFEPRRWQAALDAVDAVTSGSYSVSPDACTRATAVAPLSSVVNAETPTAARVHCVIYNLAFVSVAP